MTHAESSNPYAAPLADLTAAPEAPLTDQAEAEAIRRAYLSREATVRAIGGAGAGLAALLALMGTILAVRVAASFVLPLRGGRVIAGPGRDWRFVYGVVFYAVLTWATLTMSRGLRRLRPWARWAWIVPGVPVVVFALAGGGLASFAIDPVFGLGLALWGAAPLAVVGLLMGPKTARVVSRPYRDVIARTPHLKPRLSLRAKIAGGLVLILSLLGFALMVRPA